MMIKFLLLGAFECEVGSADRKPLGDALAAKILAFLAYQARFCGRDEIVAACWGSAKVSGRGKLDDEAYKKQIMNIRAIFTDRLRLSSDEYFFSQSNGAELREGTFTTDLIEFNELFATGQNAALPKNEREAALQQAQGLRRGYFLDRIDCEFVVTQDGGARKDWAARFQDVRREIELLRQSDEVTGSGKITYYASLYDLLPTMRKVIATASHEIILYGLNFHATVPYAFDSLLGRLRSRVSVKVLMLDPNGNWRDAMAETTDNDALTLQVEGASSLRWLRELAARVLRETQAAGAPMPGLEVALFDDLIHGSIFAIDPDSDSGSLFYLPYMNGVSPARLPGYYWPNSPDSPHGSFVSELRRLWGKANNKPALSTANEHA